MWRVGPSVLMGVCMMIVKVGLSSPLGALTSSDGYDLQFNNCNIIPNMMECLSGPSSSDSDVDTCAKTEWIILSVHLKEMLVKHCC
jgi:hypothetical protein